MAALFPPWTNTALRVGLGAGFAGFALMVAAPFVYVRTPFFNRQGDPVEQPVAFDHRHHSGDDAVGCLYCHGGAERSANAGIPSTDTCMGCHAQVWPDSAMLEPVRRSWFSDASIPWTRVHELPQYVYFDHSVHVHAGVGCASCHGRVDRMARVFQVAPLNMAWCLDCHRNPAPHLRPRSEVASMEWQPPADAEAFGRRLAKEYGIQPLVNCSACHR